MITIDTLTIFLGWCSVINIGVLVFTSIMLMMLKGPIAKVHGRLFGLNRENLPSTYFQYLGNYKIAIFMLNVVPYMALKMVA